MKFLLVGLLASLSLNGLLIWELRNQDISHEQALAPYETIWGTIGRVAGPGPVTYGSGSSFIEIGHQPDTLVMFRNITIIDVRPYARAPFSHHF